MGLRLVRGRVCFLRAISYVVLNCTSRHAILSVSKGRISSQKGKINIPSWEGCRVSGGVGMLASPVGVLNALRHLRGRHNVSPRVRGNQQRYERRTERNRSIPACTGEPAESMTPGSNPWVYPRVYGGTELITDWSWSDCGLSPRVRGNLVLGGAVCSVSGLSPRVRGNHRLAYISPLKGGLSPRVRGNPT